jgi:hypothetical protein
MNDLEAAWRDLDAATPHGWCVGRPNRDDERAEWHQYAFDPSERAKAGARELATGQTDLVHASWPPRWLGLELEAHASVDHNGSSGGRRQARPEGLEKLVASRVS